MSTTIYKYTLPRMAVIELPLPEGAEILHFAVQHGALTIWARVDPSLPDTLRIFAICGTGQGVPTKADGRYIGTCFDGEFVWHLFEPPQEPRP